MCPRHIQDCSISETIYMFLLVAALLATTATAHCQPGKYVFDCFFLVKRGISLLSNKLLKLYVDCPKETKIVCCCLLLNGYSGLVTGIGSHVRAFFLARAPFLAASGSSFSSLIFLAFCKASTNLS